MKSGNERRGRAELEDEILSSFFFAKAENTSEEIQTRANYKFGFVIQREGGGPLERLPFSIGKYKYNVQSRK